MQPYHDRAIYLLGIEEVGCAPGLGTLEFSLVHVNANDGFGSHLPKRVNDCQPNCSQAKDRRCSSFFYLHIVPVLLLRRCIFSGIRIQPVCQRRCSAEW